MDTFRSAVKRWSFWRRLAQIVAGSITATGVAVGLLAPFWASSIDGKYELLLFALVPALIFSIYRGWPRLPNYSGGRPPAKVSIEIGDILTKPRFVVGATTTFDTELPQIITPTSLQGQVTNSLFNGNWVELSRLLAVSLSSTSPIGSFGPADSKSGNQSFYEVGTIAPVRAPTNQAIYFVAYSHMSAENEARATVDGIWESLSATWKAVRTTANGEPVAFPLIGQGLARVSNLLTPIDIVRLTSLSFVLACRREPIASELVIVISPTAARSIDLPEVQRFFDSLR